MGMEREKGLEMNRDRVSGGILGDSGGGGEMSSLLFAEWTPRALCAADDAAVSPFGS